MKTQLNLFNKYSSRISFSALKLSVILFTLPLPSVLASSIYTPSLDSANSELSFNTPTIKNYSQKALHEADAALAHRLVELEQNGDFAKLQQFLTSNDEDQSPTKNYFRARSLQYGLGTPVNVAEAIAIYKSKSQSKHAPSLMCWADALLQTTDKEDHALAASLLEQASELSPLYGTYGYALLLSQDRILGKSKELIPELFEKAALTNDIESKRRHALYLAGFLESFPPAKVDPSKSSEILSTLYTVNKDSLSGILLLHLNRNFPKANPTLDPNKTLANIKNESSPVVQRLIGDYLAANPETQTSAKAHYRNAANKEDIHSIYALANILFSEKSNPESVRLARTHYLQLAKKGHVESSYRAAIMCLKGMGGDKDLKAAQPLLLHSALRQHPAAQNELGAGYLSGAFGSPDPVAATAWFQKAAELGYPTAFLNLGSIYEIGIGTKINLQKAGAAYAEGARRENPAATFALARFYEHGAGIPADPPKAHALYRLAQQRGAGEKAGLAAKKLATKLTPEQRQQAETLHAEMSQPTPQK